MAQTLLGNLEVTTAGNLPETGTIAPDFTLIKNDLTPSRLQDFKGKRVVMNIFPSLETHVCAASARAFNQRAAALENTVVLCISRDLPFAQNRFCTMEGIGNVMFLSSFRTSEFGQNYGVELLDGPFEGLLARAVVVLDESGIVVYRQLVPSIDDEPDYDSALANLV